jgi:hypothetical protein
LKFPSSRFERPGSEDVFSAESAAGKFQISLARITITITKREKEKGEMRTSEA